MRLIKRRTNHKPIRSCPWCGSECTTGYGYRKTKQELKHKRQCKNCGKSYTDQDYTYWKLKNRRDIIEDAIKLSETMSYRDAAKLIEEKYNIKISYGTIAYWRNNKKQIFEKVIKEMYGL